jgi:hypothetical protein
MDADFLLPSVAPDFAWVGDPPGSCFLDPGAYLVFVLVEAIAAQDVAPRERFRRLTHQALVKLPSAVQGSSPARIGW